MLSIAVFFSAALAAALYAFLRRRLNGGGSQAGGGLPEANLQPAERTPASPDASNLLAAYNRSLALRAKHLAFATAADAEGFRGAAALFRAAAMADAIHAALFAQRLAAAGKTQLGTTVTGSVVPAISGETTGGGMEVPAPRRLDWDGSDASTLSRTTENLKACAEESIRLHEAFYGNFWKAAREERDKASVEAFNYARTVARELASLFSKALENPEEWKAEGRTFYVCSVCGRVQIELKGTQCTLCFADNSKFVAIR